MKMLEKSHTLSPVREKAELGLIAARKLDRISDLIRFATQRSVMEQIGGGTVSRSEVEARMALGQYEAALALAESAMLKEDQLQLLAVIVKAKKKQGLAPDRELNERIRQIYDQIDSTLLGEKAVDLAADLIYSNHDVAISLIEKDSQHFKVGRELPYFVLDN